MGVARPADGVGVMARLGNNGRLHGSGPLRRRRVLVVDDDPVTVDWLRMVVEQAPVEPPFEVRSASLGKVGEAIFDEWRPEIVLLDLLLPDGDGLRC